MPRAGWAHSAFLRPADNRTFEDVIRDLARDEQEHGQQDPSSNGSNGNERIKEFPSLENRPAVGGVHRSHPHK
jgi:hypothetical protein